MQRRAYSVLITVLLVAGLLIARQMQQPDSQLDRSLLHLGDGPAAKEDGIAVYFSPRGGCEEAVVSQIESARQTIDMQAYSFTSVPIARALGEAAARGVHIRAVLDKTASEERGCEADYLVERNIPTFTDDEHPIAHNKVMVIDGQNVITGSFNFTYQAEHANAENLVILTGKLAIAQGYERNFEEHLGHSRPFVAGGSGQSERSR